VFISHTSELQDFPAGRSYVAAVKEAVSAAGHVIVDMADFPAADQPAADLCVERVRGCEVYVGVLGTRYGSPVRDRPEVSYTELEFATATDASLDRLVFLLDTNADGVGIPPAKLIDREFGGRQDAFRARVRDSGLVKLSFASPAELGQLVERSLRELAKTKTRVDSGIVREQVPAEPQPVRASKFVNPPPATAPAWFQDRQVETGLLAKHVTDPAIAMVTVAGRGGIGKTAMVCRLLKDLEAGRIPDLEGTYGKITVGGIVYLSSKGVHQVDYPTLVGDLPRLLPAAEAQRLQRLYQDPHRTPREVMLAVLEAFPAGDPVVVLLDNLESVMDAAQENLTEQALHEALSTVLTAPAHAITVIVTTRVTPAALIALEPAAQRQLRLEKGLDAPDAQKVLRELDDDGHLRLRDAPDELLNGLCAHTRGFPRALEAVKAILDGDPTLSPSDLLDRTRHLPEDRVVQVLVGEAYDLLDAAGKQVMQALAVFPAPVSAVGVDFLLQPVNPTTDAAPILARLVRRQLVRFQDGLYYLHPVDRDYARGQLPPGSPGDAPAAFTLTGLQARAADYFSQIRTPRASWHTLDNLAPQLAEFDLRCDSADYDTAATVLQDIDFDYLQLWGHYRMLVDLHGRIDGHITDPALNAVHLTDLAGCHFSLGEYRQAIDLNARALAIARDIGNRELESSELIGLGNCQSRLGEYRQAIDLYTQALAINRDTGNRQGEGSTLGNLGSCHDSLGDYRQAIDLHTQSLAIARDIGDRQGEGNALANLGLCQLRQGDYRQAIDLSTRSLAIALDTGNRELESIELCNLGICHSDLGDYQQAIDLHTEALAIARHTGDRYSEASALNYLGRTWLTSGDPRQAVVLLEQAVTVADATGDLESAVTARSALARAQLQLDDPAAALAAATKQSELPYPAEEPTMRLLAGLALLGLDRASEAVPALSDALTAADALLALADQNVAALQARALALAGLPVATGDYGRASEAVQALTRLPSATSAAGVAADTRRLLDVIASHDHAGILAELRVAQDQ